MAVGYDISASASYSKSQAARGQQSTRDLITGQTGDIIMGGKGGVTKGALSWPLVALVLGGVLLAVWLYQRQK